MLGKSGPCVAEITLCRNTIMTTKVWRKYGEYGGPVREPARGPARCGPHAPVLFMLPRSLVRVPPRPAPPRSRQHHDGIFALQMPRSSRSRNPTGRSLVSGFADATGEQGAGMTSWLC
jgi:hypothetical protein